MNKKTTSFAEYNIDRLGDDFLEKYWDYEKNTLNPFEVSYGSNKKVWVKCDKKKHHQSYEVKCKGFSMGNGCLYCWSKKVNYFDSLGFLYHDLAKRIARDKRNGIEILDTYKIPIKAHRKYYLSCPACGKDSDLKIPVYNLVQRCNYCNYCSDGVSIPEKFILELLTELKIQFIPQYSPEWAEGKRYDFYIPSLNMIIETHGTQHYKENKRGLSLKEEQENDKVKKKKALLNEIQTYLVIDCRKSEFEWLKFNVNKQLDTFFSLYDINWKNIWLKSQKSNVLKTWELWNSGIESTKQISEILKLDRSVVTEYLKRGSEANVVIYDIPKIKKLVGFNQRGRNNPTARHIVCITTKKIFLSLSEGTKYYNLSGTSISNCCRGVAKSAGKLKTGEKLVWRYLAWKHSKKYRIKINCKYNMNKLQRLGESRTL